MAMLNNQRVIHIIPQDIIDRRGYLGPPAMATENLQLHPSWGILARQPALPRQVGRQVRRWTNQTLGRDWADFQHL